MKFAPNYENKNVAENESRDENKIREAFEDVKNRLLEWYSLDHDDDISEWPIGEDNAQRYLDSGTNPLNVAIEKQQDQNAKENEVRENVGSGSRKSLSATLNMISKVEDKELRHKLIDAFKNIIKKRRNALLEAETKLTDRIAADPSQLDMNDTEILNFIQEESGLSSLAAEEAEEIESALLKIKEKRKEIARVMSENDGDGRRVFRDVFGVDPEGNVEVEMGVVNYRFYVESQADFVNVMSGDNSPDYMASKFIANLALGGFDPKNDAVVIPEFESFVDIMKKYTGSEKSKAELLRHEEQHAINTLLFKSKLNEEHGIPEKFSEFSESDKEQILINNLRGQAKAWTKTQSGEMLARLRETEDTDGNEAVKAALSDMYSKLQNQYEPYFKEVLVDQGMSKTKAFSLVRENFTEYGQRLIERGGEAIKHLSTKGYSNDEIVNLFQGKPIQDWKKLAQRYARES